MVRFDRIKKASWALLFVVVGLAEMRSLAQQPAQGAAAPPAQDNAPPPVVRTDISGDWAVVSNEDQPHRVPGPELGDYTGLPLNDADRQKADALRAQKMQVRDEMWRLQDELERTEVQRRKYE